MFVKVVSQRGDPFWRQSLTKLRFFELTQYNRLIYFDVDGLVLRNMNHLFRLPNAPVAMPRAYWLPQPYMSDQLAVVEPSAKRLHELLHQAETYGELPRASDAEGCHDALPECCGSLAVDEMYTAQARHVHLLAECLFDAQSALLRQEARRCGMIACRWV